MFVPFLDTGRRSSVVNDVRVSLAVAIDFWIDIQCLERTLSNQKEITLTYDPIKPYAPGSYTLEPAKVTYTNPETGKEETVESNALDITVNGTAEHTLDTVHEFRRLNEYSDRRLNWQPDGRFDRRRKPVSPYTRAYLFLSRFIPPPRRPYLHQTPLAA